MLLVRYLHGTTLDCSVISTQNNSFKVLDDGNLSGLSFLKEDEFDPCMRRPRFDVYATCNSWMLYGSNIPDIPFDSLWNPTTGENEKLPFFSFCSERLSSPWAYGLGYDPAGDTVKVLRCRMRDDVLCENDSGKLYVELLSLSAASDSWKQIFCPHNPFQIGPSLQPSLYINGFYYWATDEGSIVSFDFAAEKFGPLIPKPESNNFDLLYEGTVYPGEYDASLAAVVFYVEDRQFLKTTDPVAPFVFEIWVWKETATWSLVFTGEIPASDDAYVVKVLGLYKNCKLFLSDSYGDLLVYDCESRGLVKVNLGIRDKSPGMLEVFPYVANAESSFKSSSRNLWSRDTTTSVDGVPATIRAHTRRLKPNDSLMLMVQCLVDWTRIFYVISTANNLFEVLQGDDKHLPDLSRLNAENYDVDCGNAKYHVEASCNTWMLWSCNVPSDRLLLWDPRTDVFVTLPSLVSEPRVPCPTSIALWGFGTGFDPCAPGDYKVVRCRTLEYFRSDNEAYAEVFSLETWNQIPYPHDLMWKVYQHPSLFINGFYYWTAQHSTTEDVAIISFDFAKEEFPPAIIPMPGSIVVRDITIYCVSLAEYHGNLAAIVFDYGEQYDRGMNIGYPTRKNKNKNNNKKKKNSDSFTFEIWVWKHRCWSLVSTYEVPPTPTRVVFMRVIGLYKKVFLLQDWQGYLWLYDPETLKLENLDIRDNSSTLTVFPYV